MGMKEFLLRAREHAGDIARLLAAIDRTALQSGRLVITPQMIGDVLAIMANEAIRVDGVAIAEDGTIRLNAVYGAMTLAYTMKLAQLTVSGGAAEGRISYTEQRRGGGIGGAFLGITGKSGLAVALSKHRWLSVTDHEILISAQNLPRSLRMAFQSASPAGLVFRIS